MEPDEDDDLDGSFAASGTPAGAASEGVESLIAKMSEFVQRCAPSGEATELNEQLWSLQAQVKLLAANQGGGGTRGSRSASRRISSEKKKKKKKTEAALGEPNHPTPPDPDPDPNPDLAGTRARTVI